MRKVKDPTKVYWDSATFLAWLQMESPWAKCGARLEDARKGEILIVSSALTLTEVLWLNDKPRLPADKAEFLRKWFRQRFFRIVNLDRKIAERAQSLVWESDIRPKDAVHVATALQYGCSVLETFDRKLISKSSNLKQLEIREPPTPLQGNLFDKQRSLN